MNSGGSIAAYIPISEVVGINDYNIGFIRTLAA
jgi:hypothetical protein